MNPFGNLLYYLFLGRNGIFLLGAIFWVWVTYDCITKESSEGNDKLAWLLFILLVPIIGALVYYFVRRPERVKALGR